MRCRRARASSSRSSRSVTWVVNCSSCPPEMMHTGTTASSAVSASAMSGEIGDFEGVRVSSRSKATRRAAGIGPGYKRPAGGSELLVGVRVPALPAALQRADLPHLRLAELEAEHLEVGALTHRARGLRDRQDAELDVPAQHDLRGLDVVPRGDLLEHGLGEQRGAAG